MKVILLIGMCGTGKTWVMRKLIEKLKLEKLGKIGMFYFHRDEKIMVLGKYDGSTFEGSDKLSMAVMRDLDKFVLSCAGKTVICEGDRFMNSTFIGKVDPFIVKITSDGSKGRKLRKSNQTERQLKTIGTRVSNITGHYNVDSSDRALKEILMLLGKDVWQNENQKKTSKQDQSGSRENSKRPKTSRTRGRK